MAVQTGDIIRCVAKMSRAGIDDYVNVWHVEIATPDPGGDGAVADDLADFLDARYQTINLDIAANVQYDLIEFTNVTRNELLPSRNWPVLANGAAGGEVLPNQNAAYIYWRTIAPRRRSGKFIPPYTETSNTGNGTLLAAAVTRLQTFGDAWVGPLSQTGTSFAYGPFNPTLSSFELAVSAHVASTFATQRRRRVGTGS